MQILESNEEAPFADRMQRCLDEQDDPRLAEVFARLNDIVQRR